MKSRKFLKILYILIWLLIWEGVSLLAHNHVLLAGPVDTLQALFQMLREGEFYRSLLYSLAGILGGLFAGAFLGIASAFLGYKWNHFADFLAPLVTAVKSVPVASFVIILLVWFGNRITAALVVALVSFPILYIATLEGLRGMDEKLLEMAAVYKIRGFRRLRFIYLPAIRTELLGAFSLAIGMGFKSGTAAEVIGQPLHTIGNSLYRAKILLETDRLFAWTIAIVLLTFLTEQLLRKIFRMREDRKK